MSDYIYGSRVRYRLKSSTIEGGHTTLYTKHFFLIKHLDDIWRDPAAIMTDLLSDSQWEKYPGVHYVEEALRELEINGMVESREIA